jgi:hypothetical protein
MLHSIMFTHAVPLLFDRFVSHVMLYARETFVFIFCFVFRFSVSIVHVHHFHHILYRKYLFNYIVPNIHVSQYKIDVKVCVNLWLRI